MKRKDPKNSFGESEYETRKNTGDGKPRFGGISPITYTDEEADSKRTTWHLGKKLRETTQYFRSNVKAISKNRNQAEEQDKVLKEEAESAFKHLYGNLYNEHYRTLGGKEKEEMALHKEVQIKWLIADILELKEGKSAVWHNKEAVAKECEKRLGVRM